jgi:hypothetical protein
MFVLKILLLKLGIKEVVSCCTPDIILPSRKRRVINLKTIHRGKNQLVFFQALVLP